MCPSPQSAAHYKNKEKWGGGGGGGGGGEWLSAGVWPPSRWRHQWRGLRPSLGEVCSSPSLSLVRTSWGGSLHDRVSSQKLYITMHTITHIIPIWNSSPRQEGASNAAQVGQHHSKSGGYVVRHLHKEANTCRYNNVNAHWLATSFPCSTEFIPVTSNIVSTDFGCVGRGGGGGGCAFATISEHGTAQQRSYLSLVMICSVIGNHHNHCSMLLLCNGFAFSHH